ncbi:WD40/YVTN/BNR-like repeat-containing protein [Halarchaeum acidiphilum]|uniref:WD40/YVTN/BNR-like repeat-containing protein n=1 Tax=Halarchaeum acidiphilum TaxID=489138 RepID=UPI000677B305|nr:glycosyl hydrolase [Halarchaeum acidiphilum]
MAIIAGTRDGVYRFADDDGTDAEQVLDSGDSLRVRTFDGVAGVFAATTSGLYRSRDGGDTWADLDVPRAEVYSVVASPDGERLYAGTHPAHLYVSTDLGETWRELDGFQDLPTRDDWHTPRHRNEAHVRSLGVHPDRPDRMIAGVEVGGVHVSDDRGETWTERRDGLQDDVHHVLVIGPEEYVASCGGGLYRTADAGRSWTRLDTDFDHRYFREAALVGGRLYAAAARDPPGSWRGETGADGVLLESTDRGESFADVSYPGGPEEVVLAWTHDGESVYAGTNEGRLVRRSADGAWTDAGRAPDGIRALESL